MLTHGSIGAGDGTVQPIVRTFPQDAPRFAFRLVFTDLSGDGGAASKECGVVAGKFNRNRPGLYDDAEYCDFGDVAEGDDRHFPRSFVDSYNDGKARGDQIDGLLRKGSPLPPDVARLLQYFADHPALNHEGTTTKTHESFAAFLKDLTGTQPTKAIKDYIGRRVLQFTGDVKTMPLMWVTRADLLSPCQHVRLRLPTMHVMKSINVCAWEQLHLNMDKAALRASGVSKDVASKSLVKAVAAKKGSDGTKLNYSVRDR